MQNPVISSNPRPTLLSVLCILTFLSSISGLWTQSERLWSPGIVADQMTQIFEQIQESLEGQTNEESVKMLERIFASISPSLTAENIRNSAIILLIYESLTLYGAYLMWNLRKRGFYLYIGGTIAALLLPFLLIGGWLGIILTFGEAFFSVLFGLLYAINLKHME